MMASTVVANPFMLAGRSRPTGSMQNAPITALNRRIPMRFVMVTDLRSFASSQRWQANHRNHGDRPGSASLRLRERLD
jgi:hypothetical protein